MTRSRRDGCGRSSRVRPETTTPTTLAEFVHEVVLPMIAEPVAR